MGFPRLGEPLRHAPAQDSVHFGNGKPLSPDETELIKAVETLQADTVKRLLARGVNPKVIKAGGNDTLLSTVLILLPQNPATALEIVSALIGAGANLDQADDRGRAPLAIACLRFHRNQEAYLSALKQLVQAGANVNPTPKEAEIPLHSLIRTARKVSEDSKALYLEAASCLLNAGADPNRVDDVLEKTALDLAANGMSQRIPIKGVVSLDWPEMVSLLLGKGAEPYRADGKTHAIQEACAYGHREAYRLLQSTLRPTDRAAILLGCLVKATLYRQTDLVGEILREPLDLGRAPDGIPITPLQAAILTQNLALLLALTEKGLGGAGNIETGDQKGFFPLHLACYGAGYSPETQEFLPSPKDSRLEIAPEWEAGVEAILSTFQGLNVNQRNNEGYTPLMLAAMKGHIRTIRVLMEWGADPALQNNDGLTALDMMQSTPSVPVEKRRILSKLLAL